MNKIAFSIFVLSVLCFTTFNNQADAEEIVLCISQTDEYVAKVNNKRDCLENENHMVISGKKMEEKQNLTPVANFKTNEKCEGEGSITEIGFDENNNGKLETDEIESSQSICSTPLVAEEDELALENN